MTLPPHMQLFSTLQDRVTGRVPMETTPVFEMDPSIYLDAALLEDERAKLFKARPIIIGHVDQLKQAGDHFTHDHLGAPLLAVRGHDGAIRVFLNVCRHRGMRLVSEAVSGRKPAFVCPYHNWTYDLDGSLKHVPLEETFDGVDMSCRSLKEVRSDVQGGFIWAQIDDRQPVNVPDWLGTLSSDLEALGTEKQYVFRQVTTTRKTNWKLIVEAFQDGYHVTRLHKKTVGPFFTDSQSVVERVSEHLRAIVARQEFAETLDMPPEKWDARYHVSFAHYVFPNTVLVYHPEYISHLGLFPRAADETDIVHTFLVPEYPETEAARDHCERSFDLIENGVFQSEDYFACENIQSGLASGANDVLLAGQHEVGIKMFQDIVNEALVGA